MTLVCEVALEHRGLDLLEVAEGAAHGVVDQDAHGTELARDARERFDDLRLVRDVARIGAGSRQLRRELSQAALGAREQGDLIAARGEAAHERAARAGADTGDDANSFGHGALLQACCGREGSGDELEPIVAEEELVADEEARRAEHAALGGRRRLAIEPRRDVVARGALEQLLASETGLLQHAHELRVLAEIALAVPHRAEHL